MSKNSYICIIPAVAEMRDGSHFIEEIHEIGCHHEEYAFLLSEPAYGKRLQDDSD